ncbi:MAG: hypothetical protein HY865_06885 [Chloroflexi bacterium]|nr:hypothetical protein [Chloroflexota bacterium]
MKTIFRIVVILVVAFLVGGLFYGAVTATSSGTDQSSMPERSTDGEFPPDGLRPEREDDGAIQFPVDAVKNLVIISVIAAIYLNVGRLFGGKKSTANPPS